MSGTARTGSPTASQLALAAAFASLAAAQSGWVQRPVAGPSARAYLPLAFDLNRGKTVLFGGFNGPVLGDTWEWDGVQWTQRTPSVSPPPRCCHAMAFDAVRGRVVLFGGTDGFRDLDDTWEWDGTNWLAHTPASRPSPRREARAAFDWSVSRVVVFGGGAGNLGYPTYGDTWEWDGVTWTQRVTPSPSTRWSHGIAFDWASNGLVLFGGGVFGSMNPVLGDTWVAQGGAWQVRLPPASPQPTMRLQLVESLRSRVVVRFGGQSSVSPPNYLNDTWVWDGRTWTRDPRSGPPGRWQHGVAFDQWRDRMVVFGGSHNSTYLSDTWEYELDALASWSPLGTACGVSAGVPSLALAARPVAGTSVRLDLTGLGAATAASIAIGFSDTLLGGVPVLPLDLTPAGMTGCTLSASAEVVVPVSIAAGSAALTLAIPLSSMIGLRFFGTAFVADIGANPLGVVLSNSCAATIGLF